MSIRSRGERERESCAIETARRLARRSATGLVVVGFVVVGFVVVVVGFVVVGSSSSSDSFAITTLMSSSALRGIPIPTVPPSNGALMAMTSYTRSPAITRSLNRVALSGFLYHQIVFAVRRSDGFECFIGLRVLEVLDRAIAGDKNDQFGVRLADDVGVGIERKRFHKVVVDGGVVTRGILGPKVKSAIFYGATEPITRLRISVHVVGLHFLLQQSPRVSAQSRRTTHLGADSARGHQERRARRQCDFLKLHGVRCASVRARQSGE